MTIQTARKDPLLPLHGLLFPISSKGSFMCTIPQTVVFVIPVVEHWLEREIAQYKQMANPENLVVCVCGGGGGGGGGGGWKDGGAS